VLQHELNRGKRILSNDLFISNKFRSSVDELIAHSFVKHPKKISNDPENLAEDIAKLLNIYKRKDSIDSEATTNIDQIIGMNI
jgi:hypothetical protein